MATSSATVVIISCLLLQLAGGKDLYWQPNSNWNNPSNWALGRVPACNDHASLASVPANSVIYLDSDATVQSISLPANGRLVIALSVTIHLSSASDCTVPGNTQPMAAPVVENEFIGAATNYWECGSNWVTKDDLPAQHSPCGDDRAFFDKGSFSFVESNDSIYVQSLNVRGINIQSQMMLTSSEFNLKSIEIETKCSDDPSLCPCPDDSLCPKTVAAKVGANSVGGIVGGVVFGIVVLVAIIAVLVVIAVLLYLRYRPTARYVKDDLDEPELGTSSPPNQTAASPDENKLYDNPLFDEGEAKVDLSQEVDKASFGDDPAVVSGMTVYESNPPLYADTGEAEDDKHVPKLNKYERF